MHATIIASSSAGNCALIEAGDTRVFIDAGIAPRTVRKRLRAVHGKVPAAVDAIILTHAHGDHARHCRPLQRSFDAALYATEPAARHLGLVEQPGALVIDPQSPFTIGELEVSPFPLPHDTPQISLVLAHGDDRLGIATDFGFVPEGLCEHLAGCQTVLLESNHDPTMLANGPYPPHIKRRVASALGHLSNDQAAELLRNLDPPPAEVVLMHLSETNNRPGLALNSASAAVPRGTKLHVAQRRDTLCVPAPQLVLDL